MRAGMPFDHVALACLGAILLSSCSIRLPIDPLKPAPPSLPPHAAVTQPNSPTELVPVWLTADEFHTGMIFPYGWLIESGFVPPEGFGNPQYVAMSWGNSNAYSEEGIHGFLPWARVLLTPTPSVMEMIPINWKIIEVCPRQRIWQRWTPRDRGPILAAFLNRCSKTDANGRPVVVRPSSWGQGVQLQSEYSYFIPRVCNVWSAQTIECMGGKINPWFGLTADGLIRQVEQPPNHFHQIWNGGRRMPTATPQKTTAL